MVVEVKKLNHPIGHFRLLLLSCAIIKAGKIEANTIIPDSAIIRVLRGVAFQNRKLYESSKKLILCKKNKRGDAQKSINTKKESIH